VNGGNGSLRQYMKEHVSLYIFVSVLFVVGAVFGALIVGALTLEQKEDLSQYVGSYFLAIEQGGTADPQAAFGQLAAMHLKWIAFIWVLGLSVVGMPIIMGLSFLKGALVGFAVGYLAGQLSWDGVLFSLVSVAPHNLIVIPALTICSVAALSFSLFLIRNRFMQRNGSLKQPLISYSLITVSMAMILLGAALFEAYVSPEMMRWVTPVLTNASEIVSAMRASF